MLPGQGLRRGSLTEWFVPGLDSGGATLALRVAWQACGRGGTLVIVDAERSFYPPAAAAWGIDLRRLLLVRPDQPVDALWAMDQALRCPAVDAVWSCLRDVNDRWFRRFQLAAERSRCLGVFVRPNSACGQLSSAELQVLVTPSATRSAPVLQCATATATPTGEATEAIRLRVELARCRRSGRTGSVRLLL